MELRSSADYGPQLNVLVWLLVSLSALFLFTRLYLKNSQNRGLWWDDWILLSSWIALTIQAGITAYAINLGYGKPLIPLANVPYFGLPINILSTLLIIANLWGKTSFAVTLLRIPVLWMRICLWYILVSLTLTLSASVVLVWTGCAPFQLRTGCVPLDVSIRFNVFSCAYSALADVALAILPWRYLLGLQMNRKEKIGVLVAMSMGLLAGATAAAKATTVPRVNTPDARSSIPLLALGTAEAAICIMAASIPILRALARGSARGPVPMGYPGDCPSAMAEPSQTRTMSPALPPQLQGRPGRSSSQLDRLDDTLVAGNGEAVPPKIDFERDDQDSIEMNNCQGRPRSPVDFTR